MTFAKFSILLLFRRIMSATRAVQAFITLSVLIGIYFVFSIFATSFQCGATRAWIVMPDTCSTHGDIAYAVIAMNMLTDMMLAIWILPSLWKLQMGVGSRIVVMSLFGARIIVPLVAIGQLVLTQRYLDSPDQTWTRLPVTILDLVVLYLSVIHATLPRIHGFLAKLQTGMLATRVVANIPRTPSRGSRASSRRRGSGVPAAPTNGSSERGRGRKIDGRLYVSSSSYDYPLPDEKESDTDRYDVDRIEPIREEAEGNFTGGLRLRPDIMPGSKWSTTIHGGPGASKEQVRQHSSSTKGEDNNMQMGSRTDEDNSQSSIYDGVQPGVKAGAGMPQTHILETREFRMQVEQMQKDGHLVDVTSRESTRQR
ncbi:MAG: hypothetical protein INR71_04765 [Terriglobus roseus]|nr:hypothetical protein [Terriglobus roseus]